MEQISSFIQEKEIEIDFQGEVKIDFTSL